MTTKLGTAIVDVQPDFSAFDRLVAKKLGSSFANAGEQSGRDFSKGFDKHTSGILIPIDRALRDVAKSTDKVTAATKQSAREVNAFGRDGSASFNATRAAADAAAKAAQGVGASLADISPAARLDIKLGAADEDIARLRARLAELTAKPQAVEVRADTAKALAELERVERKKRELSATKAHVDVDVDRSIAGRISDVAASARGLVSSLGSGGGGLGDVTARVSLGFINFGASLTPVVIAAGAAAAAIGVALVGALLALASSAALAVAAVGALGAALGGVLGASLGLLIPVAIRLSKVFESLKADNAAADAAARGTAAGSAAASAAARAQESATRGLSEAQRQMGLASKAAFREMQDAAEAASDAVRGVANAQESLASAKLSIRENENELAKFRAEMGATGAAFGDVFEKFTDVSVDTSGLRKAISDASAASGTSVSGDDELKLERLILNVRDAKLHEKDAIDGVSDATRTASRAQERHNEFVKQGELASEGYRSALRGEESATLAVAAANEQAQGGAAATAQEKATQLAGRLTKAEVRLKDTIQDVGKALRGAFTPATDAVITGLTTGLSRVPKLVNPLRGSIGRLGDAWRKSIETFSADLIRPDSIAKLKAFTDAAADLAGPITRGMSALLDVLTDIGRAALPFLVRGARRVADEMARWAKATGNTKRLDSIIGGLVKHLKTWLGVTAALGNVFVSFLIGAAGPGQKLADSFTAMANEKARWLRSDDGRAALTKFFKDTIPLAKTVVSGFVSLVAFTIKFGQVAAPVLETVFHAFGKVVDVVQDVIHWFGEHKTASTILLSVLGGFAATWAAYSIGAGIAAAATATFAGAMTVLSAVLFANPIGLTIAAIVGLGAALVIAYKRSETFRKVVGAAVDFVKNHWEELLVVIGGPLGIVVLEVIKHFDSIKAAASKVIDFIREHWKTIFVLLTGPVGLAALFIAKHFETIKDAARTLLRVLVGVFDKIAGGFSSMLTALSHIPGFGWARTAANDIDGARTALRKLSAGLNDIPADKKIKLHLTLTPESRRALTALNKLGDSVGGPQGNGRIGRATGGIIPGFGTADNVPLWGTPGEFMTRRAIVQHIGPTVFADINAGRLDPRVGYEAGQRPSVGTVRASGPRLATGGMVGVLERPERPHVTTHVHPVVPGGQRAPDPIALGVVTARVIEDRFGGDPGQD